MSIKSKVKQEEFPSSLFIENFNLNKSVQNAIFKDDINLKGSPSPVSYKYTNCSFHKLIISKIQVASLEFESCDFKEIEFNSIDVNSLKFTNCFSKSLLLFQSKINSLALESEAYFHSIELKDGNYSNFEIANSAFDVLLVKVDRPINATFIQSPKPENGEIGNSKIKFEGVKGGGLISIKNCDYAELELVNCSGLSHVTIDDSEIKSIPITKSPLTTLSFNNSKIGDLKMMNSNLQNLHVVDGEFDSIRVGKSSIVNYSFRPSDSLLSPLRIGNLTLYELTLTNNSSLEMKDLNCAILSIDEINNKGGDIKISDSKVSIQFSFEKGNLGAAVFSNLNLQNCISIKTLNSSFTNSKFFNVQWRRDYRVYEYRKEIDECDSNEKKVTSYYYPLRESYRQLISVSNKELNKIDSLFFQKQELRIYFEIIKFDKWKSWVNFQDFLVLGSNKLFSDFGQNIWIPIKWWIPIHGILFYILVQTNDLGIGIGRNHSWPAFWKGLGIFLNLLSPIHSSEINKVSIYGVTDFTMRIVAGYFLYYFLSASRKFHLQK